MYTIKTVKVLVCECGRQHVLEDAPPARMNDEVSQPQHVTRKGRANKWWTPAEDAELKALISGGKGPKFAARELGRTMAAINSRYGRLTTAQAPQHVKDLREGVGVYKSIGDVKAALATIEPKNKSQQARNAVIRATEIGAPFTIAMLTKGCKTATVKDVGNAILRDAKNPNSYLAKNCNIRKSGGRIIITPKHVDFNDMAGGR